MHGYNKSGIPRKQRKMEEGNKRMIGENLIILGSTELEDKQNKETEED